MLLCIFLKVWVVLYMFLPALLVLLINTVTVGKLYCSGHLYVVLHEDDSAYVSENHRYTLQDENMQGV